MAIFKVSRICYVDARSAGDAIEATIGLQHTEVDSQRIERAPDGVFVTRAAQLTRRAWLGYWRSRRVCFALGAVSGMAAMYAIDHPDATLRTVGGFVAVIPARRSCRWTDALMAVRRHLSVPQGRRGT